MRNLLSSQSTLIHGLAEGTSLATHADAIPRSVDEESIYLANDVDKVSQLELRAQALPDYLDVLLAERKVTEALITLDEGERLAIEGQRENGDEPFVAPLQAVLFEQRARLAEELMEAVSQPSVRGAELRSAITALNKLVRDLELTPSSVAAGGLRAVVECVEIALGYCLLLEEQGLALSLALMKLLQPNVEQALDANLKRIEESTTATTAHFRYMSTRKKL